VGRLGRWLQIYGVEALKDACRDTRRIHWIDDAIGDARYALRVLRANPAFTIAVIATLTLAIGANTAIFSVVNAVLLKPLPFPDPERIVVFLNASPSITSAGASPARFNFWKQQAKCASRYLRVSLRSRQSEADEVPGATVAILSYPFWESRFGKRADIVGLTVHIDGSPATIIGVMPEGFVFVYEM
jgi:hypothetical protein